MNANFPTDASLDILIQVKSALFHRMSDEAPRVPRTGPYRSSSMLLLLRKVDVQKIDLNLICDCQTAQNGEVDNHESDEVPPQNSNSTTRSPPLVKDKDFTTCTGDHGINNGKGTVRYQCGLCGKYYHSRGKKLLGVTYQFFIGKRR